MTELKTLAAMIVSLLTIATPQASAAKKQAAADDWKNPAVFERNRLQMRATTSCDDKRQSLNGIWNFKFYETPDQRSLDFFRTDLDDSSWDTMPVPGLWELNGYGDPLYVNTGYAWKGNYKNNPPVPPTERNHVGQYRRSFVLDEAWSGREVFLCIGSATSSVRVWINGKEVGYSQDSKLEARFNISKYVVPGENQIALEIYRWCDGSYLEDQDFWRFSGLSRDTYIYSRPKVRLEDLNVQAASDGSLSILVKATQGVKSVSAALLDSDGNELWQGSAAVPQQKTSEGLLEAHIDATVAGVDLWTAETPNLYTVAVKALGTKGAQLDEMSVKTGFRTVEIKGGQLLVNGQPVLIKGADRHEMNPYSGYIVSEADMVRDIQIMKQLNINAVRTCHYPDDPMWLDLCDRYGLYVVAEANIESHGMGYDDKTLAKDPQFAAAHLSRYQRMVYRDINHPSIIVWSLGNEAGYGPNFEQCYDWGKAYDKTRPVQYERAYKNKRSGKPVELERATDIFCPMYASYRTCEEYAKSNPPMPLIQCEYAHAMGNSMGGFKEYWDLYRKYPSLQGGFIWDFVDQAIWWPSDASVTGSDHFFAFGGDFNDYDPSDNSFNCNGIIAADRSLHPHAYEVAYQYRSILSSAEPSEAANGRIKVYNENFFVDLSRYVLDWDVVVDGEAVLSGCCAKIDAAPQQTVSLDLGFNLSDIATAYAGRNETATVGAGESAKALDGHDVYLNLSYRLSHRDGLLAAGTQVAYDQIEIQKGAAVLPTFVDGKATRQDSGSLVTFSGLTSYNGCSAGRTTSWSVGFDSASGALCSYILGNSQLVKSALMPCFGRAVTENDMGAKTYKDMKQWLYPDMSLQSFEVKDNAGTDEDECWTVDAVYKVNASALVQMHYTIHPNGVIEIEEQMKDLKNLSAEPCMFRFGMEFTMPGLYNNIDFYGKGPHETYADRQSSALVGHYVQKVSDQYHWGHARPQASGTHVGLRWFNVIDDSGWGLSFTSAEEFSACALPIARKDLDLAARGGDRRDRNPLAQVHSLDLKSLAHENDRSNGVTHVNLDLVEMGLGCVTSWGALPRDEYMIHPDEYSFKLVLAPEMN